MIPNSAAKVCLGSGQRPTRAKFTLGLVECSWCGKRVYLTMQGKLYKHKEKRGV